MLNNSNQYANNNYNAGAPVQPANIRSHANPVDMNLARSSVPVAKPAKAFFKLGSSFWYMAAGVFLIATAALTPPFRAGRPMDLEGNNNDGNDRRNDILRIVGSVCFLLGAIHRVLDDHSRRTMIKHGGDPTLANNNANYVAPVDASGRRSYEGAPHTHLKTPLSVRALEWVRRIGSYIQLAGSVIFLAGAVRALQSPLRFTEDGEGDSNRGAVGLWIAGLALLTLGLIVKTFTEAMSLIRFHFHAEHKQNRQTSSLIGTLMLLPGAILLTLGSILYLANSSNLYRIANILWMAGGSLVILGSIAKLLGDSNYYRTKHTSTARLAKSQQGAVYNNNMNAVPMQGVAVHNGPSQMIAA